jgi:hypothetical protein
MTVVCSAVAIVFVAGAPSAPATVASQAARCPSGARSAITNAYFSVFSRSQPTPTDTRVAALADGDDPALRSALAEWLADPTDNSSTVTVRHIRCPSRTRATMDLELQLASTPLPKVLPRGIAVREDGVWKVARSTFCTRLATSNPDFAAPGNACAQAAR